MISYKKICLNFLLPILLPSITIANVNYAQNFSQNLWQPRPFSSYKAREIIALQDHKLRDNILSFSMEYMQNFGSDCDRLGSLPFWSGTNTMTIGTRDGKSDLDGYQFGLGDVTKTGSITINPKIQHVGGEMLWRVAHSSDNRGPYFQIKIPLVAHRTTIEVCETPATTSTDEDPDWITYPSQAVRYKTLTQALTSSFEQREPDLEFGRLHPGQNTQIRCGDIETSVGYNIHSSDKGYIGIGFKASLPTGNTPAAEFMLEPMVGRAGHWGIGGEVHGNYKFYHNSDTTIHLTMRGDVLHLLSGRRPHWRSFDLTLNGPGSKYLLVQRYVPTTTTSGSAIVTDRLPQEILPAIDITTIPTFSTFSAEGSFALGINMQKRHWNLSVIGELWGRSQERLSIDTVELQTEKEENLNDFAILGRQIDAKNLSPTGDPNPTAELYYCEPLARINKAAQRQNTTTNSDPDNVKDARLSRNRISADHKTSLDIVGAQAARALTGKVTVEFGYTWTKSKLTPHVSLFTGIEFANQRSRFENLWSIGAQGSMTF